MKEVFKTNLLMLNQEKHKKIDFLNTGEITERPTLLPAPKKPNRFWRFVKYFLIFILILIILTVTLSAVLFFRFKGIYELAISGKSNLEYSVDAAREKDFEKMLESSRAAEKYFGDILEELGLLKNNLFVKNFNLASDELAEIEYLIESARVISKSVEQAAVIAQEMDNILSGQFGASFSEFSGEEKERLLKLIYESGPELNGVKANLDLALINLDRIRAQGILSLIQDRIENIKDQLTLAVSYLSQTMLASQILPELAGYPDQSAFLILFQNNTELRPTGGFLGTYGILETKNGDIIRFDTHDIYHMDMPLETLENFQIVPPEPIAKYLNRNWYMRDANWSPDWPSAARQIDWFYHKENSLLPEENKINNFDGEFNGVIAITPDLVISLLEIVGPITIGEEEFNRDNFVDLLQYKVEQDYANQDISSWQRKEIIGQILEELKIGLFNLHYLRWLEVSEKIGNDIKRKDILLFLKNDYLQGLVEDIGLAGEVKEVEGDYFMVVDSNMAALKTDAVMKKDIKYNLEEKEDGFIAHLRINYVHEGSHDWKTGDYKTYTRVYVPRGSQLIKAEGAESEIDTKEELDKTSFGAFFTVKVGRSRSLYFEYKLPKDIGEYIKENGYKLYVQKQPGSKVGNLELDVSLLNEVKSYNPFGLNTGAEKLNDNRIRWIGDLKTDKELEIIF